MERLAEIAEEVYRSSSAAAGDAAEEPGAAGGAAEREEAAAQASAAGAIADDGEAPERASTAPSASEGEGSSVSHLYWFHGVHGRCCWRLCATSWMFKGFCVCIRRGTDTSLRDTACLSSRTYLLCLRCYSAHVCNFLAHSACTSVRVVWVLENISEEVCAFVKGKRARKGQSRRGPGCGQSRCRSTQMPSAVPCRMGRCFRSAAASPAKVLLHMSCSGVSTLYCST